MRLDRYLSDMNVGTRKEIGALIRKGRVSVDGTFVKDPARPVGPENAVSVDAVPIPYETFSYLMLNKPKGVVSATQDPKQRTVLDLLPKIRRRDLFPVGRLDKDTTGLMLITNDGQLAHRLLSPRHHVDKTYEAVLKKPATREDILAFSRGLEIAPDADGPGFTCLPAVLSLSPDDSCRAYVTLHEGKYHQVKRMFRTRGNEVLSLKRLSMGNLSLDPHLAEGESRRLTGEEIDRCRE